MMPHHFNYFLHESVWKENLQESLTISIMISKSMLIFQLKPTFLMFKIDNTIPFVHLLFPKAHDRYKLLLVSVKTNT